MLPMANGVGARSFLSLIAICNHHALDLHPDVSIVATVRASFRPSLEHVRRTIFWPRTHNKLPSMKGDLEKFEVKMQGLKRQEASIRALLIKDGQ